jgi:hypothetical protein
MRSIVLVAPPVRDAEPRRRGQDQFSGAVVEDCPLGASESPLGVERPCARCGRAFRRTPTRWLTCPSCYVANGALDPLVSRAEIASSWKRPNGLDS